MVALPTIFESEETFAFVIELFASPNRKKKPRLFWRVIQIQTGDNIIDEALGMIESLALDAAKIKIDDAIRSVRVDSGQGGHVVDVKAKRIKFRHATENTDVLGYIYQLNEEIMPFGCIDGVFN